MYIQFTNLKSIKFKRALTNILSILSINSFKNSIRNLEVLHN